MTDLDGTVDADSRGDSIATYAGHILVCVAGPGTGKTYAFLQRVQWLLAKKKATPDEICYLTFIKEISKAFEADFEEQEELSTGAAHRPRVSTLHSFACRLIRNQGFRKGFDGPLYFGGLTNRQDSCSEVLLGDLLPLVRTANLTTVPRLRTVIEPITQAWRDRKEPASIPTSEPHVLPSLLALARAYRLIDWDQTIPFAQSLLEGMDEPPDWISRINHFLVDEYQDFNRSEQEFIATLGGIAKSMVVVGDDNQSLYSRRGGSPDGLRELQARIDVDTVSLTRSYRCKSNILKAANQFLARMQPAAQVTLPKYNGGEIVCRRFKSAKAELEYVADFLTKRIAAMSHDSRAKDGIACLLASRKALNFYMDRLEDLHVPCSTRTPQAQPERRRLEMLLRLVFNPRQRFVERLILEDFGDIKPRHKNEMVQVINGRDISPVEAIGTLLDAGMLSDAAEADARAFRDLCQILSTRDFLSIPDKVASHVGVEAQCIRNQLDTLLLLLDEPDQDAAIGNLCDGIIPESAAPPQEPGSVLFLTMHGSKGLTRRTIVMPGLEQAILPGEVSAKEEPETRRLLYVAITRATDEVLITYPRTRARGDPFNYPAPGRGERCPYVDHSGIRLM